MADLIPPEDLKVETVRQHQGGQHVGYTSEPIKVTHIPTGRKCRRTTVSGA